MRPKLPRWVFIVMACAYVIHLLRCVDHMGGCLGTTVPQALFLVAEHLHLLSALHFAHLASTPKRFSRGAVGYADGGRQSGISPPLTVGAVVIPRHPHRHPALSLYKATETSLLACGVNRTTRVAYGEREGKQRWRGTGDDGGRGRSEGTSDDGKGVGAGRERKAMQRCGCDLVLEVVAGDEVSSDGLARAVRMMDTDRKLGYVSLDSCARDEAGRRLWCDGGYWGMRTAEHFAEQVYGPVSRRGETLFRTEALACVGKVGDNHVRMGDRMREVGWGGAKCPAVPVLQRPKVWPGRMGLPREGKAVRDVVAAAAASVASMDPRGVRTLHLAMLHILGGWGWLASAVACALCAATGSAPIPLWAVPSWCVCRGISAAAVMWTLCGRSPRNAAHGLRAYLASGLSSFVLWVAHAAPVIGVRRVRMAAAALWLLGFLALELGPQPVRSLTPDPGAGVSAALCMVQGTLLLWMVGTPAGMNRSRIWRYLAVFTPKVLFAHAWLCAGLALARS